MVQSNVARSRTALSMNHWASAAFSSFASQAGVCGEQQARRINDLHRAAGVRVR